MQGAQPSGPEWGDGVMRSPRQRVGGSYFIDQHVLDQIKSEKQGLFLATAGHLMRSFQDAGGDLETLVIAFERRDPTGFGIAGIEARVSGWSL